MKTITPKQAKNFIKNLITSESKFRMYAQNWVVSETNFRV
jgi:hypothetical protein